jgi:PAS domain S-box-containing protein
MLDTEGRVVSWNQGAERIFGYTEREILGQPAAVTFSEEDRAASVPERELMTAARDGQAADDRWHVRKGGDRFWANGVLTALRTDDGALRGFAKVLRDNTERKRAEDELRWLNETLEARVRERTEQVRELASTLAMAEQDERRRIAQILHDDLQQLLFGIQLKMTFVRRDAEEAGQTDLAEHAAEADRFLDRAIHVTRQLTVDLSPPILAGEGLTHALEWLTTQMEEVHNLSVEVLAGQPFVVSSEGMRVLLFQVVRELLFNVVKHADTDRALVTLDDEDGTLVITVEDEGRGFDPDTLEPKTEGGFGLFSVRERLRLFGGHLEIDSTPGNGTRMTAVLPAILLPVEDD